MKRIAVLVAIAALSTTSCAGVLPRPTLPAGPSWHWDNVVALPPGTLIRVTATDRARHHGTLIAADDVTLRLQTKHGAASFQVPLVRCVERLTAPPRSRARNGLVSAAAGAAALLITEAMFCQALGGRPCWSAPKSIAGAAVVGGALGAMGENGRPMTIYVRP